MAHPRRRIHNHLRGPGRSARDSCNGNRSPTRDFSEIERSQRSRHHTGPPSVRNLGQTRPGSLTPAPSRIATQASCARLCDGLHTPRRHEASQKNAAPPLASTRSGHCPEQRIAYPPFVKSHTRRGWRLRQMPPAGYLGQEASALRPYRPKKPSPPGSGERVRVRGLKNHPNNHSGAF